MEDADKGVCVRTNSKESATNECARPKPQQKEKTEKRVPESKGRSNVGNESERENVSKMRFWVTMNQVHQ